MLDSFSDDRLTRNGNVNKKGKPIANWCYREQSNSAIKQKWSTLFKNNRISIDSCSSIEPLWITKSLDQYLLLHVLEAISILMGCSKSGLLKQLGNIKIKDQDYVCQLKNTAFMQHYIIHSLVYEPKVPMGESQTHIICYRVTVCIWNSKCEENTFQNHKCN